MAATGTSQLLSYAGLTAASLVVGYWAGVGSTLSFTRSDAPTVPEKEPQEKRNSRRKDEDSDEEIYDGEELDKVKPAGMEECKLVFVVRTDLGMTPGKIAAQCSHATLACYKALNATNPALLQHWEKTGQTKVVLRADNDEELDILEASARSLNICARAIHDAGRTQIASGSRTVLGIGPGPIRLINQVTGRLRLL